MIKQFQKPNQILVKNVGNYHGGMKNAQQPCLENVEHGRNGKKHQTDQTKELYVNARNKSKDILNKAKTDKWKEFISTLTYKANSKHIWNVIAKFNGKPFKLVEVLKANNTRYHDNKD